MQQGVGDRGQLLIDIVLIIELRRDITDGLPTLDRLDVFNITPAPMRLLLSLYPGGLDMAS